MQVQWLWGAPSEKGSMGARRDMTTQWVHNTTPTIEVLTGIPLIVYTHLVDLCRISTLFTCSFMPPPPPLHPKTIWRWIYDTIHTSFRTSTITLFSATNMSAVTLAAATTAHLPPLSLPESMYTVPTQCIPPPSPLPLVNASPLSLSSIQLWASTCIVNVTMANPLLSPSLTWFPPLSCTVVAVLPRFHHHQHD